MNLVWADSERADVILQAVAHCRNGVDATKHLRHSKGTSVEAGWIDGEHVRSAHHRDTWDAGTLRDDRRNSAIRIGPVAEHGVGAKICDGPQGPAADRLPHAPCMRPSK